jgi:hypothetical protein
MTIYEKIQNCRVELQSKNLKKTGQNKFAGFTYYELSDFLPEINKLMQEQKLFSAISFTEELATLKIINSEKPDEVVEFTSPMRTLELKGCNAIQALGGIETYQRRYLYVMALEITESDMFDSSSGQDEKPSKTSNKPVNNQVNTNTTEAKKVDIKQAQSVYMQAKTKGFDDAKIKEVIKKKFNIESCKDLTIEQHKELVIALNNLPNKEEEKKENE